MTFFVTSNYTTCWDTTNAKVRRGEIQLEQTDELDQDTDATAALTAPSGAPPGPTDASLAASRVDLGADSPKGAS